MIFDPVDLGVHYFQTNPYRCSMKYELYIYKYVYIYTCIMCPKKIYTQYIYIYIRSTPRPVTADKWFSFNLPFQNEHKEIAPKISARRCLKKSSTCPPNLWYRIQNSRQGLHFQDLSSISVAFQHWERRAQTTDNTFMCYPEKVRAKRLHRSKD